MKKFFVTGGAGFIGSAFVRLLLDEFAGASVTNFDALTYAGNLDNLEGLDPARHRFVRGDIGDRRAVLDKLRVSKKDLHRNLYAAFVNVSAATYYASPATWPDIQYEGVSVDHPEILDRPPPVPWRPADPRPIEK